MNTLLSAQLSPEQAADVIRMFHSAENSEAIKNGWRAKISLGQSALHAVRLQGLRSLQSRDGEALLTFQEMNEGLDHLARKASMEDYLDSPVRDRDARELASGDDTLD